MHYNVFNGNVIIRAKFYVLRVAVNRFLNKRLTKEVKSVGEDRDNMLCRLFVSLCFVLSYFSCAIAQEPVQIFYEERVPYAVTSEEGKVEGLTATPITVAFEKAGIPIQWRNMPFKRQLITIKANKTFACGIGWFKKPEREEFARFSDPIYQDRPTIVIGKKESNILSKYSTVEDLVKANNIKLLVKDSFSYGKYLDALIDKYSPNKLVVVGSSNLEMLQLLLVGRADYFFVAEEEAEEMIRSAGYSISDFTFHHYKDMPSGNFRYLACSQNVPSEMMNRINNSLR